MALTDHQLEAKISSLKETIDRWIVDEGNRFGATLTWYGFASAADYFDEEPKTTPCALVMSTDETLAQLFSEDVDFGSRFDRVIAGTDFYYENEDSISKGFYAKDNDLNEAFRDYFEWNWVCQLVTADYSDLHEELFLRFVKKPDDFRRIEPRKFEHLLDAIFRNNGYATKLGPRTGDGGVDIHLFAKDAIGEFVTLVQAKRYATDRPIGLEAVSALAAHIEDQKANRGVFVTTSRFLPSAKRFSARQGRRLQLMATPELVEFSKIAATRVIRDKSALVSDAYILQLVSRDVGKGLEGAIVVADWGYDMTLNDFCILLKETPSAALLMELPRKVVSGGDSKLDDPSGQTGFEVPICDSTITSFRTTAKVFRAKRDVDADGQVTFWGRRRLYNIWDGKPRYFNLCD